MALTFFTVTGNYLSFAGQELWDDPGSLVPRPVSGSVVFTPLVGRGDTLKADLVQPSRLFLQPVQASIVDGRVCRHGVDGCRLVANTAALNLSGDLFYEARFVDVRAANGESVVLREFRFAALKSDLVLDLVSVTPDPGYDALGNVQLIPGPEGPRGPKGDKGDPGTLSGNVDGGTP